MDRNPKPALKSPPELADELEPWIKDEELTHSSLSDPASTSRFRSQRYKAIPAIQTPIPSHRSTIIRMSLISGSSTLRSGSLRADEDRELQKVQKAYNQLFNIYQRQEKLGEQYEVIVGAGLLLWTSPNSGEIKKKRRISLASQARIEFDRVRGIMSAGPALDGPQPILECSMLETTDRPNPSDLTSIENDAISLDGDPWDAVGLERVFRGFANSLPIAGDYAPSLEHAGGISEKPVVRLAPALILRKRTRRSFEDFYRQIIEQIKDGEEIPENIRRIIDIVDDSPSRGKEGAEIEAGTTTATPSDIELYFPLPANDEQKRIVQKVEHRRGVLVQGPPGTGKSHTIANLICHFLAKGKRILVTSETPRALKALRSKLPPEIEELCVIWLGSDPDSQKALEQSVIGITQRKANWDASKELNLIDQFTHRLEVGRSDQARLRHDLRACRELDIYQHLNVFGRYSGTSQQIAAQINQERDRFQWFADRPRDATDPVVTSDDLLKMVQIHRKRAPELDEQLKCRLFQPEQLIQPNEFFRLVEAEKKANLAHKEAQDKRSYPGYAQLSALDRQKRETVKGIIERILTTQDTLSKHFHSWAERAAREISGDQDRVWRQVLASTIDHIDHIEHRLNEHSTLDVTGLVTQDFRLVEEHAIALKKHLEMGKGLGFWFVRARVVEDGLYLVKSVTVNGKPQQPADAEPTYRMD